MSFNDFGPVEELYAANSGGNRKVWYFVLGGFILGGIVAFAIFKEQKLKSQKEQNN